MQIGEFFVNLGIKGSDKAVGALTNVKKGLGEAASMSLEAKAGIVAAMYALERLFATSGQAGTGLTNFNTLLGTSTKTLQQYQYAARQMGVANEDVAGTFKGLQSAMTKTLTGEGAPKGLARVAQLTGGITPQDIAKFQQNPELLVQKLQMYALKEKNTGLRNEVLKSFNVSDSMISAMARNAFNPGALAKAPAYGDKEIASLDKANIAWSNLGTKIEMAVGHFNAKHGAQLVGDISKIVDQVVRLTEAFTKLADKLKLFQVLSKTMGIAASVVGDLATETGGTKAEKETMRAEHIKAAKSEKPPWWAQFGSVGAPELNPESIAPKVTPMAGESAAPTTNNVNVTQNFQHDGRDHVKTADSTKKGIQDAFRQRPLGRAT